MYVKPDFTYVKHQPGVYSVLVEGNHIGHVRKRFGFGSKQEVWEPVCPRFGTGKGVNSSRGKAAEALFMKAAR
jgi:hypothetical protein